jgi:hypothetical protein
MVHHQTIESSRMSLELGARFVLHSSDAGLLLRAMQRDFAALRDAAATAGGEKPAKKSRNTLDVV